jgi:hypothetical protein
MLNNLNRLYLAAIIGYFGFKVLYHLIIEFMDDQALAAKSALLMQLFDVICLGGMLIIFRSRQWPPFFTVGLNEILNVSSPTLSFCLDVEW